MHRFFYRRPGRITLTRADLYEQVWSVSMRDLAKRYGLSDVGLAKLCRRHRIPTPPRGYWRRKETGKRVVRARLPPLDEEWPIELPRPKSREELAEPPEVTAQKAFEADPAHHIQVPMRLTRPLPALAPAHTALRTQRPDDRGRVSWQSDIVTIKVGSKRVSRATRIAHTLVRALVDRGFEIAEAQDKARLERYGERVTFTLEEPARRLKRPARWREGGQEYYYELTGKLRLTLGFPPSRTWNDRIEQPLEERLNDVVLGCVEWVVWRRRETLKRERREARWKAEADRRRALRERVEAERAAVLELHRAAGLWRRAEALRSYVDAREQQGPASPELEAWCRWARAQADRADPLIESPASILDTDPDELDPPSYYFGWGGGDDD